MYVQKNRRYSYYMLKEKTMRIEYLIVIEQLDNFCGSKEDFITLLEKNSQIKIIDDKLKFNEIFEIDFQIETKQILGEKQRYFHLILNCKNELKIEIFTDISNAIIMEISESLKKYKIVITTLWNDISIHYATLSYPLLNEIENLMRHLISKIMILKVGMDWDKKHISNLINEKSQRKKKGNNGDKCLEQKIHLPKETLHDFDFITLSSFLFDKFAIKDINDLSIFISKYKINEKISVRELKKYTKVSNWDRFFSRLIDYEFALLESQWKELYGLRNKVAHNKTVTKEDFIKIENLTSSIGLTLKDGIKKADKMELSAEERVNIFLSTGRLNPLHVASAKGNLEVVKYLIGEAYNINSRDNDGNTPLHLVSDKGHLEIAEVLIKNGAAINAKTKYSKETPLYIATDAGHLDMIKFLIESGANINDQNSSADTPLHIAARKGYLNIVEYLITKGANVNARNNFDVDVTPLLKASTSGHLEIVTLLIKNGARINEGDNLSEAPLFKTASQGQLEIAKILINNNAIVNVTNFFEETPLYAASIKGHFEIVKLLIANEADVNARSNRGITPLLAAAGNGNFLIVECLVTNGANIDVKDNNGKTPLDYAKEKKYLDVVALLSNIK